MAYFGTKVSFSEWNFTIKIHGPLDAVDIHPIVIKGHSLDILKDIDKDSTMADHANTLADRLARIYCDGNRRLWVEVTAELPNGTVYSASSAQLDELDDIKV